MRYCPMLDCMDKSIIIRLNEVLSYLDYEIGVACLAAYPALLL
jgi:hypothetical protein